VRRVDLAMTLGSAALIIADDSGVIYENQVGGGNFCFQMELEGILIPCDLGYPSDSYKTTITYELEQVFQSRGADPIRTLSDPSVIADEIDRILASHPELRWVSVDRSRLDESMNAWVYVKLDPGEATVVLQGFESTRGVLTWPGSD
jgi:hypothetical protein